MAQASRSAAHPKISHSRDPLTSQILRGDESASASRSQLRPLRGKPCAHGHQLRDDALRLFEGTRSSPVLMMALAPGSSQDTCCLAGFLRADQVGDNRPSLSSALSSGNSPEHRGGAATCRRKNPGRYQDDIILYSALWIRIPHRPGLHRAPRIVSNISPRRRRRSGPQLPDVHFP